MDQFDFAFGLNLPPSTDASISAPSCQPHNDISPKKEYDHNSDRDDVYLLSSDVDATVRIVGNETLYSKLRHVRNCITSRFTFRPQRTPRPDIGIYAGFDEYARKPSSGTTTPISSIDTSTILDNGSDVDINSLLEPPSAAYDHQPQRRRSSARLSRLGTRVVSIARFGFVKLQTDPEEKAARQERRLREKKERIRWIDDFENYGYDSYQAQFVPQGNESMDWRMALAFMPW